MPRELSKSEQRRLNAQQGAQVATNPAPNPFTHPDAARDLPPITASHEAENAENTAQDETPGQIPTVVKNRIPVPNVSHVGEKVER